MKPGVVGSVLVVLAGGAVAGAVVLRDQTKAQRAEAEVKTAEAALEGGDLDGAERGFLGAGRAAGEVGGLGGKREQALAVSRRVRAGLRTIRALRAVEQDPRHALRVLSTLDPAPAQGEDLPPKVQAELLLQSALLLEARDQDDAATALFGAAQQALSAVSSPRAAEAELGKRRLTLIAAVREAEEAVANRRVERALEVSRQALEVLAEPGSPFSDEAKVTALRGRLKAIEAEAESGHLLDAWEARIAALAERVNGPDLGRLLAEVQAAKAPELLGEHPRAADHAKRRETIEARRKGLESTAAAFAGMVWIKRTARGSLFMDPTEVTVAAFRAFLPAYTKQDVAIWGPEGLGKLKNGDFQSKDGKPGPYTWLGGKAPPNEDEHPVTGVSYFEAEAYARWAKKRLPSVEELQQAALGQPFPWGGDRYLPGYANLKESVGQRRDLARVKSFPKGATKSGIYDLVGNAREFARGPDGRYFLVGGSFEKRPEDSDLTKLGTCTPYSRGRDIGFRCVKELEWNE
ncbi:MAG: SUMF1/EgtB/PvdO family nonheme iron enzyme [Planctomycetota bacterium]